VVRARAAATVVLVLAALSSAALAADKVNVRISPRTGGAQTTFRVGFTAPHAAGHQGVMERSYTVDLMAAKGKSCQRELAMTVAKAAAGERVRLAFRGRLPWCRGQGRGTVSEETGPYCPPGGGPCPLFPSRIQTIARFSFSVR
jgi:hypothetical protein